MHNNLNTLKTELKLLINADINCKEDVEEYIDPINMMEKKFFFSGYNSMTLPFFGSKVAAGSPALADEFVEDLINLNDCLVKNPPSTYFMRAVGVLMMNVGIYPGDLLIVDRSVEPDNGKIVVATFGGGLIVRRYYNDNGSILLLPENDDYNAIDITDKPNISVWGVVTAVIHRF